MTPNTATLERLFTGFKTLYNTNFEATEAFADQIAMTVISTGSEEEYGWLGQFPELREWLGERVIKKLSKHGFKIKNKKFESTISVSRDDVADDKLGMYNPMLSDIGRMAKVHPDKLVFGLLKSGFETMCYDGQNFFDHDHPVHIDGDEVSVSNMQDGTGPAWYLLDTSRSIRPIIWQEREPYKLVSITNDDNYNVFMKDEYVYGVRARVNAGFGLWQLAYASKAPLTPDNYNAARSKMMGQKATDGQRLGIRPTVLVVSPDHESAARQILKASHIDGSSNIWQDSAELIVSFDVAA